FFKFKGGQEPQQADDCIRLLNGTLEGSNVNAVGEMTALIDLQRHFEMQVKLMKTAEEMDKSSSSLMRIS
ncbi:flagellar basal body rod C-terminal domain-containing protein, partial [Photobacterium damselae]